MKVFRFLPIVITRFYDFNFKLEAQSKGMTKVLAIMQIIIAVLQSSIIGGVNYCLKC